MTLPNGTVTQGLNELNRRACISRVSVHMKTADLKKLQIFVSLLFSDFDITPLRYFLPWI